MFGSVTRKMSALAIVAVILIGTAFPAYAAPATWAANPASDDTQVWRGIAWSPELGIFVGVGSGANAAMTSPDGINWTPRTTPDATHVWRGIAWSSELHLFAAVGTAGSGTTTVMTSSNGINWTLRDPGAIGTYMGITWSPEQSKFVATAAPASGALTSSDGITWTPVPAAAQPIGGRNVIWVAEDNQYVAMRSPVTSAYTSPDGITWTPHTTPRTGLDVAYSETNDVYVSVGSVGVMTSPDGANWTAQTSPITNLRAIEWSPQNNEFAAVGLGGIMTSSDGVNWVTATNPAVNTWEAITWSPELSRYAGVAIDGVDRTLVGIVPAVSTPPLNLVGALEGQQPKLTWTTPIFDGNVAITGYRIERSVNGGPFTELVADTGSTDTTYVDAAVESGTIYGYRIFALNAQGQSVASNEVTVETDAAPPVASEPNPSGTLAGTGSNQMSASIAAFGITLLGIAVLRLLKTRT